LQILIFLYFDFFLKQAILTSTQTKKINNLENDELKSNVFKTPLKIKFFWDNAENVKNDANISRMFFFLGSSLFFSIFLFF